MFVRMDLSLKYSQKRNFFHFFEQKKQTFQKQGVVMLHALPLFTPLSAFKNHARLYTALQCIYPTNIV